MNQDWMDCKNVPNDHSVSAVPPLANIFRIDEAAKFIQLLPVGGYDLDFGRVFPPGQIHISPSNNLFKLTIGIQGQAGGEVVYSFSELAVNTVAFTKPLVSPYGVGELPYDVKAISPVEPVGVLIDNKHIWALQCQIFRQRKEQSLAREQLKKDILAELIPTIESLESRIEELEIQRNSTSQ